MEDGGGGRTRYSRNGRSRMTINPHIPTVPGGSMSGSSNQLDIACTKRERREVGQGRGGGQFLHETRCCGAQPRVQSFRKSR